MTEVVLFIGRNGAGKTTCANFLADFLEDRGCRVQQLSFATPLKEIVNKYFNTTKEQGGRKILEDFGQDMKRYLGTDIWARALVKSIDEDADYVIIDDLRYPIEYDAVASEYTTYTIHVARESALRESCDITNLDRVRFNNLLKVLDYKNVIMDGTVESDIRDEIDGVLEAINFFDAEPFFPVDLLIKCMADTNAVTDAELAMSGHTTYAVPNGVDAVVIADGKVYPIVFKNL